ncbi:BtpA/SgcQ family protein [Candidatus Synechococcus spongiarum]|uniref:BtpA/SgcQ family protein n=1 Tax=Candidatus Synechococcus spongiarum TaxID=431041 RepID=UPI0027D2459D|nr:BtpA/SgcQ family protein [Candidatus Synechococcus spongiarum]
MAADGVIVSGDSTGTPVELEILQQASHASRGAPVLIGSGFGPATADHLCPLCNGVIVAAALKRDGRLCNPVDLQRVAQMRGQFHP